jgi:hypothetical protein
MLYAPKQHKNSNDSPLRVVSTPFGWMKRRVRFAVRVILEGSSPVQWYPIFERYKKNHGGLNNPRTYV